MGKKHYGHSHHSHHHHHGHESPWSHQLFSDDFMFGTCAKDVLKGSDKSEIIFGLRGDDDIAGGDGNDWVIGGRGNDHVDGGPGSDKVFGGKGDDVATYVAAENAKAEELARQATIKLLFPMVFLIFPALLAVLIGPAIPQIMDALGNL